MIQSFAPGELICRHSFTTANTIETCLQPITVPLEITLVLLPVYGNASTVVHIYHFVADGGAVTFNDDNMVLLHPHDNDSDDKAFQAQYPGTGLQLNVGDALGAEATFADSTTLSIYGVSPFQA